MNKLSKKYGLGKIGEKLEKIGDRPLFCDSGFCVSGFVEKPDAAAVLMLDAGWCDVGSWTALWEISPKNDQGNACKGDVLALDTRNSLIMVDSRLVVSGTARVTNREKSFLVTENQSTYIPVGVPRIYSVLPEIIDNSPAFHYSRPAMETILLTIFGCVLWLSRDKNLHLENLAPLLEKKSK
jgi:hypothetical protein